MTVKEFMERVGITETGRAIAYIKDGLEEINLLSPTNITTIRLDIEENKRFYNIPNDIVKITDIRCKNHLNSKDEYRSVPRMIGEPIIEDADQELI
tara:strand:+ start:1411 stop:1698 length:288 start_codon:yes stop_codon:yes gene_type:complete